MMENSNYIFMDNFYNYHISEGSDNLLTTFIQQLLSQIKHRNYIDLTYFLQHEQTIQKITEFSYDILVALTSVLNLQITNQDKQVVVNCNKVLQTVACYCKPSELFLFLLEQMDMTTSDQCFYSLLTPLKICLFRCQNPVLVFDMCVDNIKKFMHKLSLPMYKEDNDLYDTMLERIMILHIKILHFIEDLFNHFHLLFRYNNIKFKDRTKYFILNLLLSKFGKPLCFANFDRKICHLMYKNILRYLIFVKSDIIYFFRFINYGTLYKYYISLTETSYINNIENNKLECDSVDNLSLCNFYWTIFSKILIVKIPQVYSPYYIAYCCINLSNYLMVYEENKVIIMKAFDVLQYALNIFKEFMIPIEELELPIHNELIKNLTNFIVHDNFIEFKSLAINNLSKYIHAFNNDAKYIIIKKFISLNYHTKIISLIVSIVKDVIVDSLKPEEGQEVTEKNCLFVKNLEVLLSRICICKSDIDISLLKTSDEIIVILNFILFLIIKKKNEKISQKKFLQKSQYNFLKYIKKAVKIQKNEWILQLESLSNCDNKMIYIENKLLFEDAHYMTLYKNINSCNQALNILLLIENILCRIEEVSGVEF